MQPFLRCLQLESHKKNTEEVPLPVKAFRTSDKEVYSFFPTIKGKSDSQVQQQGAAFQPFCLLLAAASFH